MGRVQEFLNRRAEADVTAATKEVAVSNDFKDEDGSLIKFTIRAMNQKDYNAATKKHSRHTKDGRMELDYAAYCEDIVIQNTVEPSFKDAESIRGLGLATPEQYLERALLPGEIVRLANEITTLSGFNQSFSELVDEAKN
jgi:hypothetical protein